MAVFNIGGGSKWNYSDPTKPGYMPAIEGTIVEIDNPQSVNFVTKQPEFWDDGNPKRNWRFIVKGRSGAELPWVFTPRSATEKLVIQALDPDGSRDGRVAWDELLGKFVHIETWGGTGEYHAGKPRPWKFAIIGDGDAAAVRGCFDLSKQQAAPVHQVQAQPEPQAAPPQIANAQAQAAQALGYSSPAEEYYASDIPF